VTTPPLPALLRLLLLAAVTTQAVLSPDSLPAQDFLVPPEYDAIAVSTVASSDEESAVPERLDAPHPLQPVPVATTKPATVAAADTVTPPVRVRPVDPLDRLVDEAIETTGRRMLVVYDAAGVRADENTPWQIAHGILALRHDYYIRVNGRRTNAIAWVATGPSYDDKPWFVKTRWGGKGHPFTDKWQFEGHPNQFLAFFATAGLPRDFQLRAGNGETFTIDGWIRTAQMEINEKEEITWTLWALSTYLSPEARWVDQHERGWSIEKLVRMQMAVHPTKSACGGMHGLFAIANALNAYDRTGDRRRGVWLEADQHLKTHIAGIKSLQNRDGSFSANYLKGVESTQDVDKRVSTTGHTLEFLMNALSDEQLREPWVRLAIQKLADDLVRYKTQPMEPGGMYHACDALVIYRQRTRP
jgi:hypothetical protein